MLDYPGPVRVQKADMSESGLIRKNAMALVSYARFLSAEKRPGHAEAILR